jgi:hypothetical protein
MPIYAPIYNGPPKHYTERLTQKRYIAIHNTSNTNLASAEAEASYAKRRLDSVSAHYYVDPDSIVQSLNTNWRAWHAGSTQGNDDGIAYEYVGLNSKSRAWWLANIAWDLAARQTAIDCRTWNIEPRALTLSEIRAGVKTGFITHNQMRQAWGGTTHDDPGDNFPMDHLITLTKKYLDNSEGIDDDMSAEDMWTKPDLIPIKTSPPSNPTWTPANALGHSVDLGVANRTTLSEINGKLDASAVREAGMLKAIETLSGVITAGGGNVDTVALIASIREVGDDVEKLHAELLAATKRAEEAEARENTLLAAAHTAAAQG